MLSATPLHRRRASLVGVGIALVSTCLLPAAAGAAGFSGSFEPDNWSIVNVGGGVPDQTLSGSGAYTCTLDQVACAENVDPANDSVDVVGSTRNSPGGGLTATARTTTWTVTNGAQSSVLSFNWALATFASGAFNQSVSYLIGGTEIVLGGTDQDFGTLSDIPLGAGETFGFRVSTSDNSGDYGVLSITNFAAVNAPGPLPLAGGIAAFGWSRRLRTRIRQPKS